MLGVFRRRKLMCQQLVELITDYLEDALPRREARVFEAHLAMCEHCSEYVVQFKATIAATGRLDADTIEPHVMDDLLSAFRGWFDEGPDLRSAGVDPDLR